MTTPTTLRVEGPIILDWGNGMRLRISPASDPPSTPEPTRQRAGAKRGRKPSPATVALAQAMHADAAAGRQRTRQEYIALLKEAGHPGGGSANLIVSREAKRAFGSPLRRAKKANTATPKVRRLTGPAKPTAVLRARLKEDAAQGALQDTGHYVRWIVDEAGIGLKRAKPLVYRELRAIN